MEYSCLAKTESIEGYVFYLMLNELLLDLCIDYLILTRPVPLMKQELFTLVAPPAFTPSFKWGSCYSIVSFMCVFCRSLFVLLFSFFWPVCCLFFFNLRILITPLVSSNSSSNRNENLNANKVNILVYKNVFQYITDIYNTKATYLIQTPSFHSAVFHKPSVWPVPSLSFLLYFLPY